MPDDYNAIADRAYPGLRRAVLGILNGYATVTPGEIEFRIAGGYPASSIIDLVQLDTTATAGVLYGQLASIVLKAMNSEAARLAKSMKFADAFTTINPETIAFLERYSLALIGDLEADVRENIRNILIRGQREGIPVRLQAKAIAEAIGLNPRQELAMWNIHTTAYREAIESGKSIAQAETLASKAMEKARKRMVIERATTIARTETIRAQSAGTQAVWDQYQREGLLPANATKTWIVTPDDRLCVRICKPLDGVEVGLRGDFDTAAGSVPYPPAHARCRCAASIGRA